MKILIALFLSLFLFSQQGFAVSGGRTSSLKEHPWQARIGGCGAVIIGARHLLTAAHCLKKLEASDVQVLAGGDGDLKSLKRMPKTKNIFIHPNYQGWVLQDSVKVKKADIAVIELVADMVFGKTLSPIKLPSHKFSIKEWYHRDDHNFVFSGWGLTDLISEDTSQLKEGRSFYLLPRASDPYWLEDRSTIDDFIKKDPESGLDSVETFLTGDYLLFRARFSQPCKGDSGGPLVDLNSKTLLGLSAHVQRTKCGHTKYFFYTDVKKFIPWIESVTGE